jgi:7,8-dihydropterin-6-yl-methyl-4-(beta-D-ribofuranosyl)aminobenzene 5'-phosphate synthase
MDDSPASLAAAVRHDVEPAIEIDLEPVDSVAVVILMDNVTDALMTDHGPARRFDLARNPWRPLPMMAEGRVPDALIAEHGFSALVTVTKAGQEHRFLFDAGTSPDGVTENMRRLDIDPYSIEAIVCSHGHFDHTTGIDGLIRAIGRLNLPVLIHPHFWRQRRLQLPGREPRELPTTSRAALTGAGFDIIEERQPSFLFGRSVLITGEVARTTGYEPGFPPQQAFLDGRWQPDPLVLDEQALVVNVRDRGLVVLTGCGHAGVVNIARYARRLTGDQPLYALLGGFHLSGPLFEPLIPRGSSTTWPRWIPACWCPPTAPAGAPSTPCRPGSPTPTCPTPSAPASCCDGDLEFVLAGGGVRAEVLVVFLHRGDILRRCLLDLLEGRVLVAVLDQAARFVLRDVFGPQRAQPGTDAHTRLPDQYGTRPAVTASSSSVRHPVGRPSPGPFGA